MPGGGTFLEFVLASSLFRPRCFAPASGGVFCPCKFFLRLVLRLPSASGFAWSRCITNPPPFGVSARECQIAVRKALFVQTVAVLAQRSPTMLSPEFLHELHTTWLPNMTDAGVNRLIDLLEKNSPLLIHGSFTRAVPMGCLA